MSVCVDIPRSWQSRANGWYVIEDSIHMHVEPSLLTCPGNRVSISNNVRFD